MASATIVRKARLDDLDHCATALGEAFADYPWTRWCVDHADHIQRITALQRLSLEVLGFRYGLVWVGEESSQIISVAVWSDSGVEFDRSLFTTLADRSRPLHGDRLDAAIAAEQGSHPRPATNHLFLETMGTVPSHWRQGAGTAVLAPGLEVADQRGIWCALETSTEENVEFYRRSRFEVVDHRTVADGGPDVWAMQRPPRQL